MAYYHGYPSIGVIKSAGAVHCAVCGMKIPKDIPYVTQMKHLRSFNSNNTYTITARPKRVGAICPLCTLSILNPITQLTPETIQKLKELQFLQKL